MQMDNYKWGQIKASELTLEHRKKLGAYYLPPPFIYPYTSPILPPPFTIYLLPPPTLPPYFWPPPPSVTTRFRPPPNTTKFWPPPDVNPATAPRLDHRRENASQLLYVRVIPENSTTLQQAILFFLVRKKIHRLMHFNLVQWQELKMHKYVP